MAFARRARATAVIAFLSALLWIPFGIVFGLWTQSRYLLRNPAWREILSTLADGAVAGAIWGLLSGIVFAALLMAAERRGSVDRLRNGRVIACGVVGGAMFPVAMTAFMRSMPDVVSVNSLVVIAICLLGGVYGAIVAAGLLALARRPATT